MRLLLQLIDRLDSPRLGHQAKALRSRAVML
jgi:hypothetical protein